MVNKVEVRLSMVSVDKEDIKNTQTISETENTLGRILIADKTSQEKISHREDLVIEITHDET